MIWKGVKTHKLSCTLKILIRIQASVQIPYKIEVAEKIHVYDVMKHIEKKNVFEKWSFFSWKRPYWIKKTSKLNKFTR